MGAPGAQASRQYCIISNCIVDWVGKLEAASMPSDRQSIIENIRHTLAKPDTVILVGSGVSLWSGLPSWTELVLSLADFVKGLGREDEAIRREIRNGDLLLAASYGVFQLQPQEFARFIRLTFKADAAPSTVHGLIAALGPTCFVTTNFDHLLEKALAARARTTRIVTNRQLIEVADITASS